MSRARWGISVAVVVAVGLAALPARADTVWTITSAANAKPFERPKMKIDGLTPEGLLFRGAQSNRVAEPRPLKEIWRIEVDDEKPLNDAEAAFVTSKWDDAVANYKRAIQSSRKEWVKDYASLRLMTAAQKSGKFAAAAAAYAALVQRNPKSAEDAKPDIPADAKAELPEAIDTVKTALADPKLKAAQKSALQAFLVQLYLANDQTKEAAALGGQAAPAPPREVKPAVTKDDGDDRDPPGPAVRRGEDPAPAPAANKAQVDLNLQLATALLKDKKYQDAIAKIDSIADSLEDPEQQAQALFCLAEAKSALAGNDAAKLKDAALAYMRVVAHFRSHPAAPHVAESLYKSGAVLERAKLLKDAQAAYEAVKSDYADSPQAKQAAEGLARVKKALNAERG